jgi:dihydrofolate reductase
VTAGHGHDRHTEEKDIVQSLTLWMQVSLDGYACGPDGAFDWPIVGPELNQYFVDELGRAGHFLYGRTVYEIMAGFWPIVDTLPDMPPVAVAYGQVWKPMPKVVFSTTMASADWNTTVSADPVATIRELKDADGSGLVFFGGATTARTLVEHDLVDDYRLNLHPVVLGGGDRLLPELPERQNLEFVSVRVFDGTVPHIHYRRKRG